MALNQKIRLQIISALDDAGIKATAEQLERLQSKVAETQVTAQGLGRQMSAAFNPMEAVMAVATGNVNGIAKSIVQLGLAIKGVTVSLGTMTGIFGGIMLAITIVNKLTEAFKNQKTAVDEASESAKKNAEAITNAQKSIRDAMKDATGKVDEAAKRRDAELQAIEKEVAAEKRLQLETAKRNGDLETAAKLQKEIAADVKSEAIKRKENAIADIDAKIKAIDKVSNGGAEYDKKEAEKLRRRYNSQITMTAQKLKEAEAGEMDPISKSKVVDYARVDELRADLKRLQDAKTELVKQNAKKNEASQEIAKLKEDRLNMERDLSAYRKIQLAEEIKAEEQLKQERIKAEDEVHKKKMADLKIESASAAAARSRAEKEFQLYKSGNAAQVIEDEKKDEEARKQLKKDAARYGGKWRIDELASLYAQGDEKKISETLSNWRKQKSFTPEVEAMVRAAAADQNATTLEDRVTEIAENTKDLAEKIENLLTMKGE